MQWHVVFTDCIGADQGSKIMPCDRDACGQIPSSSQALCRYMPSGEVHLPRINTGQRCSNGYCAQAHTHGEKTIPTVCSCDRQSHHVWSECDFSSIALSAIQMMSRTCESWMPRPPMSICSTASCTGRQLALSTHRQCPELGTCCRPAID